MRSSLSALALVAATLSLLLSNALSAADGSVEAGAQKALPCSACHGPDGNSVNPEWPSLAGQHQKYLIKSLQDYKNNSRANVLMVGQVAALSEQDMADLAAYYAAQTPKPLTADPALAEAGERLYRGGNRERGISACIACHGPRGRGNPAAAYPVVAGQHAAYTAGQLRAYADKTRKSDPNQMMRAIAALLTEDDIKAVSAYLQGLR